MAITAQHPAVLQLTKTEAALIDPTLPESSESSIASMAEVVRERKKAKTLTFFGIVAGSIVGTMLRVWVERESGLGRQLGDVVGMIVFGLSVGLGYYVFYRRLYALDRRLQAFANGPHAINVGFLNDSWLDATDETPSVPLWRVANAYRQVKEIKVALRTADAAVRPALQARLAVASVDLDNEAAAAGLTFDTAR